MFEVIFLSTLALVWIIFATVQDLKKREIANWLSFSLIIFALGFRFFYSLFSDIGFSFFYQGLIGFGIFFILGNLLYYGKMFAGGDAKLMIALGAILPFSTVLNENLKIFLLFFVLFLLIGAVYSILTSIYLSFINFKKFKKEFLKQFKKNKKLTIFVLFVALVLIAFGFSDNLFFVLGIMMFVLPYLYIYVKSVDESCMVRKVKSNKLTEGDWLYKDLKIGKRIIKAKWDGLSQAEIKLIQKKFNYVTIRNGIPFTPVFLISFIIFFCLWKIGLWQRFGFI
ncbi:prepilin peptidase [Candidatus Pacearchaeota archaeon]|nr:prepilin peptidase [Candidatus Pacearchaeota archaeon]